MIAAGFADETEWRKLGGPHTNHQYARQHGRSTQLLPPHLQSSGRYRSQQGANDQVQVDGQCDPVARTVIEQPDHVGNAQNTAEQIRSLPAHACLTGSETAIQEEHDDRNECAGIRQIGTA